MPISDTGTEMLGMNVAQPLRRKMNTTNTTSTMEITMLLWASITEARIVRVRSLSIVEMDGRRQRGPELRQQGFDTVHRFDDVGVGLAVDLDR